MTKLIDIINAESLKLKCYWKTAEQHSKKPKKYPMKCQLCRGYGIYDHKICDTYQQIKKYN